MSPLGAITERRTGSQRTVGLYMTTCLLSRVPVRRDIHKTDRQTDGQTAPLRKITQDEEILTGTVPSVRLLRRWRR